MGASQLKTKNLPAPDLWLSVTLDRWEWDYSLSVSLIEDPDPLAEGDGVYITGTTTTKANGDPLSVRLRLLGLTAQGAERAAGACGEAGDKIN
jgi:hypothetical protein